MFDSTKAGLLSGSSPPEAEKAIQEEIEWIVSEIDRCVPGQRAIYLVGGFGRGEGTVELIDGRWRPLNDYDFVVVCDEQLTETEEKVRALSLDLSRSLKIDYVDIGLILLEKLSELPLTIENYDLKYAARLLKGEEVRNLIPSFDNREIGPFEFLRLICNRAAGLLTAELPTYKNSELYHRNQYMKAAIAVGDTIVYLQDTYHWSYAARLKMLEEIVNRNHVPFSLPDEGIFLIEEAYKRKLNVANHTFVSKPELTKAMICSAYLAITTRCTGTKVLNLAEAERALVRFFVLKNQPLRTAIYISRDLLNPRKRYVRLHGLSKMRVLFAQPMFFLLLTAGRFWQAANYLLRFYWVPTAFSRKWNSLSAVNLWQFYVH